MRRPLWFVVGSLFACSSGESPFLETKDVVGGGDPESAGVIEMDPFRTDGVNLPDYADPETEEEEGVSNSMDLFVSDRFEVFDPMETGPGDLWTPTDTGNLDLADHAASDALSPDPGTPPLTVDPSVPGSFSTKTQKADVPRGGRIIPVVAHIPDGPGPWPLVVFLPGFQASTDLYKVTVDRLATHGFLLIRAEPPASIFSVSHVEMRDDARAVMDWALGSQGPLKGLADPSRIGIMGHSLGGKVAVMTAFADARVRAVFAMDPVNGGNPITGYSNSLPDIVPEQVAPLAVPLGFPGEDWSATHAAPLSPSCNPADQNYRTFYDAAASAPWKALWSLGGADHQDFVDDPKACGFTCSVCPDGPGDDQAQISAVRTLMVAFFRRHLNEETAMEDWLIGAHVPGEVTEILHAP